MKEYHKDALNNRKIKFLFSPTNLQREPIPDPFDFYFPDHKSHFPLEDFYDVLGVEPTASREKIGKAYRQLKIVWGLKRDNGDPEGEEMVEKITQALAAVTDPLKFFLPIV